MMTLADFTTPGMIIPRLQNRDLPGVLQELGQSMQREGRVPELLPFYHAALNREYLAGTHTESGIAFPHARLPGIQQVSFAFGQLAEPLRWGSNGAPAVQLVFLLAVPATESAQYLQLLSGLVRLARHESLLKQLLLAQETVGILEIFQQLSLRKSSEPSAAGGVTAI